MNQTTNVKSYNWTYTLNNPTPEEIDTINVAKCVYHIYGKEHAEETPHLQGYIQFKAQKRMTEVKKALGTQRLHLEKSLGSSTQNITYCSKEDTNPFITGTPKQAGSRTDITQIKDLVKTHSVAELIEDGTLKNSQQVQFAHTCMQYQQEHRKEYPTVIWLCGDSGAGKSKYIYDKHHADDIHKQTGTIKWFEGYENQPIIILDDIRADFAKFHELLTLLDRYPHRVEVKGGSRIFNSPTIYITSPYNPQEMYSNKTDEKLIQLTRRIDEIHEFKHPYKTISTPKADWYAENKDNEYITIYKKTKKEELQENHVVPPTIELEEEEEDNGNPIASHYDRFIHQIGNPYPNNPEAYNTKIRTMFHLPTYHDFVFTDGYQKYISLALNPKGAPELYNYKTFIDIKMAIQYHNENTN